MPHNANLRKMSNEHRCLIFKLSKWKNIASFLIFMFPGWWVLQRKNSLFVTTTLWSSCVFWMIVLFFAVKQTLGKYFGFLTLCKFRFRWHFRGWFWSFWPKIFGPWWEPMDAICHSLNIDKLENPCP